MALNSVLRSSRAAVRNLLLVRSSLSGTAFSTGNPGSSTRSAPNDALSVIRSLECVQLDPVAAVEKNQHLVLAARVKGYRPQQLGQLLEFGRVFEYIANAACVLPVEDYPAVQGIRRRLEAGLKSEIDKYEDVARTVMNRLDKEGPLPASAFESVNKVHGYWDNTAPKTKVTSHVLNLLNDAGFIRVVKRDGNNRFFDLSAKSIPKSIWEEAEAIPTGEAERLMLEKYMRAYRVFDLSDSRFGWARWKAPQRREKLAPYLERGEVTPLEVEGCKTEYYILSEDVPFLVAWDDGRGDSQATTGWETGHSESVNFPGSRFRFLPPLDNLLWRRSRIVDLFDFDYKWEIYTPAAKRTYGYYAMPILAGDRLIGRVCPRLDRKTRTLVVEGLHLERTVKHTKKLSQALEVALSRFARVHGASEVHFVPPASLASSGARAQNKGRI